MGTAYQYICTTCKNEAFCSPSRDRGFVDVVEPMICGNCQILTDIVVARYYGRDSDPEKLPIIKCSNCLSSSELKSWDGSTCPKCEQKTMRKGNGLKLWD